MLNTTLNSQKSREQLPWIGDVTHKAGEAFEQVKNMALRRKQKRTVGDFLKENAWLPVLLGMLLLAGLVVVARVIQHNILVDDIDLDEGDDVPIG